ncbi:MAG: aldo/keto reductase [Chloroflexi bacterium]|uniref:aldo/keto reductase n=1 Tax=Candidatus Flexifilum breve TaxID=3140694 RepID=UPI003134903E|nr:aldo/keto reductase [Chloroflexota bacterium]
MQYRTFGRTGWQVAEIGYGMWGMGGWTGSDDAESLASLHRSVELGCNFFDTALAYGEGHSEKLLGQLLKAYPNQKLYTASKIPPKNRKWPATPEYDIADVFPYDYLIAMTDTSLKNMDVEQVDLMQLHVWDDHFTADDGWKRAVETLKSSGKIGAFGISINRWEPANVLEALRTGLIDAVQVVYNIFDQNPEDELYPLCRELNIGVIARVPFDEGSLTGTFTKDTRFPKEDWRSNYFTPETVAETVERIDAFKPLIPAGMSMPEFALRFILAEPTVSTIIPGMRKLRNVEANIAASDGKALSANLVDALRPHRWVRQPIPI